jgi:soluble lytic murein transglycosylase-like protein
MQSEASELCLRRRGKRDGNKRPAPKGRPHQPISRAVKLLAIAIVMAPFAIFAVLQRSPSIIPMAQAEAATNAVEDPEVPVLQRFLERYGVVPARSSRIAQALLASGRKQNVDARLLASILIVESRGDPHAISTAHAVGIMQIHVPTWGVDADTRGVNLFKIEDNVEMGARILHGYIAESGLWEGVMRYRGWSSQPGSRESAQVYADLVRQIFES